MHHLIGRITHTTAFVIPVVEVLAGTRNSLMCPPRRIDPTIHRTMNERSYHGATSRSRIEEQIRAIVPNDSAFPQNIRLLITIFILSLKF